MKSKLITIALFALLSVGTIGLSTPTSYADGNGSPVACNGNTNINPNAANVLSSKTGTDDLVQVDVGSGNIVDGVCIKSGANMFLPDTHSGVLGNGTYENGCYLVSGVGTQTATVSRLLTGRSCQEISHIDVLFSKVQTPNDPGDPTDPTTPTTPTTPGQVLGTSTPVGGVSAGAGGAASNAVATVGLLSSISLTGVGAWLARKFNV